MSDDLILTEPFFEPVAELALTTAREFLPDREAVAYFWFGLCMYAASNLAHVQNCGPRTALDAVWTVLPSDETWAARRDA